MGFSIVNETSKKSRVWSRVLWIRGALVVDPFIGSGTTAVGCHKLNRAFVGCDGDRKAVDIATARLLETGQKRSTGSIWSDVRSETKPIGLQEAHLPSRKTAWTQKL